MASLIAECTAGDCRTEASAAACGRSEAPSAQRSARKRAALARGTLAAPAPYLRENVSAAAWLRNSGDPGLVLAAAREDANRWAE